MAVYVNPDDPAIHVINNISAEFIWTQTSMTDLLLINDYGIQSIFTEWVGSKRIYDIWMEWDV